MKKRFHFAQYTMMPVTHHSMAIWKHPRNMQGGWRFDRPEVWQYMAQVCERGKFDFFFSADTGGVFSEYAGSYKPAVRYAAQIPCYDGSTMMASRNRRADCGLDGVRHDSRRPRWIPALAGVYASFD
jgi:hypothetical protein